MKRTKLCQFSRLTSNLRFSPCESNCINNIAYSHQQSRTFYHPSDNSFRWKPSLKRFTDTMKNDFKATFRRATLQESTAQWESDIFPNHCDILVVGGGVMGTAVAYSVKQTLQRPMNIVVLDKDHSHVGTQSANSIGGLRTQFSVAENVKMGLYSSKFIRRINESLEIRGQTPGEVFFQPQGFLFLGTEDDRKDLEDCHLTQIDAGASVSLMESGNLARKFPWLNCEGLAIGSYGLDNEGWLDAWKLMEALRNKSLSLGIHFTQGEVVDIIKQESSAFGQPLYAERSGVAMPLRSNSLWVKSNRFGIQKITYALLVNAAGCNAREVAEMNGIGVGKGVMSIPLPVEKRKRLFFSFTCPDGPGIDMPFLVDPLGFFVRREGLSGLYIAGFSPRTKDEDVVSQEPDTEEGRENFFKNVLWPRLAYRIPAFEKLKYNGSWENIVDWNYFDNSPIAGNHPYVYTHYFACGSSGNTVSQALALGTGFEEMAYQSEYTNIDLTKFHFTRFLNYEPVKEILMV